MHIFIRFGWRSPPCLDRCFCDRLDSTSDNELEAVKQYTAALLVDINVLCDRIASEIGQIREAGINEAISAASVDEAHQQVDNIIQAFAEQAA